MFVFITTDITMSAARLDIKEFVGTSEKIWTVKTTNRERMKCEVDHLKSIRALSIVFERSSFIRGRRRDLRLRGVFDTRYKRRMTVFYRGSFISTETMVYMDPDQSCAVFKIESLRDWDVIYYDLRLKATDAVMFHNFVRMSPQQFDFLENMVRPYIDVQRTHLRPCLSSAERLAITLRYLASGNSYQSLSYSFRVGKSTVSGLVPKVCKAIWKVLQPRVFPVLTREHLVAVAEEDLMNMMQEQVVQRPGA
ncbi:hypothetical protein MTO96_039552 [Rhipicephalus appendiculatus]